MIKPEEIKALRAKLKFSQEELGRVLCVSWNTVSRWERGKSKPSRLALEKINEFIKQDKDKES